MRKKPIEAESAPHHLERHIAAELKQRGEFSGMVTPAQLGGILVKVISAIIQEQRFAGIDVPVKHEVTEMNVKIAKQTASVSCTLQIKDPINAQIRLGYALENDAQYGRLRLKDNRLEVEEFTGTFDFAAKIALKAIGVREIARQELRNPNEVIKRVMYPHLHHHGFRGEVDTVELQLLPDNYLSVFIASA